MRDGSTAAGTAALSVCESILLSLIDHDVIDAAEARAVLVDAATTHREAARLAGDPGGEDAEAAFLLETIIQHGNAVRRADR